MFVTSVEDLQNSGDVFLTAFFKKLVIHPHWLACGDVFVTSVKNLQNIGDVFVTSVKNLQNILTSRLVVMCL